MSEAIRTGQVVRNVDGPPTPEQVRSKRGFGFGAIQIRPDGSIALEALNGGRAVTAKVPQLVNPSYVDLIPHLQVLAREQLGLHRLTAVGLIDNRDKSTIDPDADYANRASFIRHLWDDNDTVPVFVDQAKIDRHKARNGGGDVSVVDFLKKSFTEHGAPVVDVDPQTGRVFASRIATLESWQEKTPPDVWEEGMHVIDGAAKRLEGWSFVRLNTTAQAGGVAGMNHPMLRFVEAYNDVQSTKIRKGEEGHLLDVAWDTLDDKIAPEIAAKYGVDLADPELIEDYRDSTNPDKPFSVFDITKRRHNIIQGREKPGQKITPLAERVLKAWHETQAKKHEALFKQEKTVILLDDQQTDGLVEHIRAVNPNAIIAYRSHIQFRSDLGADPATVQHEVFESFLQKLTGPNAGIDAFISHRSRDEDIDAFLPKDANGEVDARIRDITMYKVATADQVDGLAKNLTPERMEQYLDDVNDYLEETGQKPIDRSVGHIGQFARFDPAKNIEGVLTSYKLFVEKMLAQGVPLDQIPEQIIAGFGASDDPDGTRILAETHATRLSDEYALIKDKIKVIRLTYDQYNDQHMNAVQRLCQVGEQLSKAEGCEDKITQLLQMGIPTIVANVGGMPPQIKDGISGYLVDLTDESAAYDQVSNHLVNYYTEVYPDPNRRAAVSKQAKDNVNHEYTTIANMRDLLGLAVLLKDRRERIPAMVQAHRAANGGRHPFARDLVLADYALGS